MAKQPAAILVVDDEEPLASLMVEILERCGHRVRLARDGYEALRIFREAGAAFDLVVSDVVMPGLSGPDMISAMLEVRPDLNVMFVSGYPVEPIRDFPTLHKPFQGTEFVEAVHAALDHPRGRGERVA